MFMMLVFEEYVVLPLYRRALMTCCGMFPPCVDIRCQRRTQIAQRLTSRFREPRERVVNFILRTRTIDEGVGRLERTLTSTSLIPSIVTHFLHLWQ